jgi:cellulose synthase/poly-beta-1,6-N-acetylglucosamine synthase-like glycosyltransferase
MNASLKKVDVSVITPVYKEPEWMVGRNFDSVFDQKTTHTYEHIFVFDAPPQSESTDETFSLLCQLTKIPHVKVVRNEVNVGLSASRNMALQSSSGEFIMLLDADDVMAPDRIQAQVDFMRERDLDHSYGSYQEIHGNNSEPSKGVVIPPEFDFEMLRRMHNFCYCGSNCFRRKVYEEIGGFDENMHDGAEDLEYWIRS